MARRSFRLRLPLTALAVVPLAALCAASCLDRPVSPLEPHTASTIVDQVKQTAVEKIDLLFMIDSSGSMADKQAILEQAVPDLVDRLVNPRCVDAAGAPLATQPPSPVEDCPAGSSREFLPVRDIHIGIVSSSLGGFGSTACAVGAQGATNDDDGHLITRGAPGQPAPVTYQGTGFLAWDADGKSGGTTDVADLKQQFAGLVAGVGEKGCGYEASLESIYRFLVDPAPYAALVHTPCATPDCIQKEGTDQVVLDQRAAFLRPDSLVAIVMLSDENDCSVVEDGQAWIAAQGDTRLPRATSVCAVNPNDPCCHSCAASPPAGCPATDVECTKPIFTQLEDEPNLRCWDQKRRFGASFLYPVERYVNAFSKNLICPDRYDLDAEHCASPIPNPLFRGVNGFQRDPTFVYVAGIVGVPWQDIARDPNDATRLDYQTADQMKKRGSFRLALGDPATNAPPGDPLMIESVLERSGVQPVTGSPLAPSSSGSALANPVNGHEQAAPDELQYACIFPLATPRDCTLQGIACDCDAAHLPFNRPLCQDPTTGTYGTQQHFAKAFPGSRELQVLQGVGDQGIVASICARNLTDDTRQDYGYRPAIGALVDRLKDHLHALCLGRTITPEPDGSVPCVVVEARPRMDGETCDCSAPGRSDVEPVLTGAVVERMAALGQCDAGNGPGSCKQALCLCNVAQATGEAQAACQNDSGPAPAANGAPADGWCYIDAARQIGNADIVKDCPATARRLLRFVGAGQAVNGATAFIACAGASL